jgi:transposase
MDTGYAVLVGWDWADQKHDVCWRETGTGRVHRETIEQRPETINEWISSLIARYPGQRIAVCVEQSRGAVVYALMGYAEVDLYPINPVTLAKYRNAFRPSGAKDDPGDAALALDLLERHRDVLKVWHPDTEATRLLRSLCEDRRKAVDARTALCNSMRARLKEYYPQVLHLVGEQLSSELCCAFLMKWPCFDMVAGASAETVRRFYYAQHSRSETAIQERLERIAKSRPLTTDPAVVESGMRWVKMLVAQIRAFNRSIHAYDERIAEVFKTHPDRAIFASFPGAGKQLGPRLVAVFGTDRSRYEEAVNIATYSGVAPVIERSGQQEWIRWRWHCPKFLRQSLVEFAGMSVMYSTWARLYYQDQIRKGKKHPAAVRTLAFKWLRILFRCWKERTTYDEAKYLAALQRHGSWIATAIKNEA